MEGERERGEGGEREGEGAIEREGGGGDQSLLRHAASTVLTWRSCDDEHTDHRNTLYSRLIQEG